MKKVEGTNLTMPQILHMSTTFDHRKAPQTPLAKHEEEGATT
jgi:hypothetical protein